MASELQPGHQQVDRPVLVNPRQAWYPWFVVVALCSIAWLGGQWVTKLDTRLAGIENNLADLLREDALTRAQFQDWITECQLIFDQYSLRVDLPALEIPPAPRSIR